MTVETCRNGHERNDVNTVIRRGKRDCLPCGREKTKRYSDRRRAAGNPIRKTTDQRHVRPISQADIERLKARTLIDERGCWIWQGSINVDNGYGYARAGGKVRIVHRVLYEAANGPVQEGLVLDHLCRVRACCNPSHLEPVTQRVNLERGESPAWRAHRAGRCQRGHEMTPDNIKNASPANAKSVAPAARPCDARARRGSARRHSVAEALITYEFSEDGLKSALEALGTTLDSVARNLLAMDFKGVREDPCKCPVARYLAAAVPDARFLDVYRESVVAYVNEEAHHNQDPDAALFAVPTPPAVSAFIGQFDGIGIADLVEEASDASS